MAKAPFTAEQQSVRVLKVGERVRHILSELLARGEVHDDIVSAAHISVTEVRMTPDLRNATAYVKALLAAGPKVSDDDVVHALQCGGGSERATVCADHDNALDGRHGHTGTAAASVGHCHRVNGHAVRVRQGPAEISRHGFPTEGVELLPRRAAV
jgi:ribosome-binding factor A